MPHIKCWLGVIVLLVPVPAHALVIDDFSEAPIRLVRSGQPVGFSQPNLDPQRVIGGARDILLGEFGADGQFIEIENGQLTLGIDQPTLGLAYLSVTYGSEAEPLSVDLLQEGNDRFLFDNPTVLHPGVVIQVGSPGGGESFGRLDVGQSTPYILYSEFTSGADFSNVSWIRLGTFRSRGFALGAIHTVAEPNGHNCSLTAVLVLSIMLRWRGVTVSGCRVSAPEC